MLLFFRATLFPLRSSEKGVSLHENILAINVLNMFYFIEQDSSIKNSKNTRF